MDAESSSNVTPPMVESRVEFPCGTKSEVLRIKSSALWLMAGHDDERMVGVIRTGEFAISLITQSFSPILITLCMVGDLQWPLTKDSPVLRLGFRTFAFTMPDLLYGLQFSDSCCEEILEGLERVLMRFSYYQDRSQRQTGTQFSVPEDDPCFWPASQSKIERITIPFLTRIGAGPGKAPTCVDNANERLLKAIRMSAITKMIVKGVLVGGIDPNEHIDIVGPSLLSDDEDSDEIEPRASATIFVFSDIVEAIEASGLIVAGKFQSMPPYEPTWSPVPGITFWNINKFGLIMILRVMVTSASLHNEMMAESEEKNEEDKKVVEQMEEEMKITEPIEEEAKFNNEHMEEEPSSEEEEEEIGCTAVIREIRFSIVEDIGRANQAGKNPIEQLGEACAHMEVA